MELGERAQLALDTIVGEPRKGIPTWQFQAMEWRMIDRLAGAAEGSYEQEPAPTYRRMLDNGGVCLLDQWIPENPLTMGRHGFEGGAPRAATTGAQEIIVDGMRIDSPEAVVEHLERYAFPALQQAMGDFDQDARVQQILAQEAAIQQVLGPSILKGGYAFVHFPTFAYGTYGYADYFMAFALYPEIIERHFALQADLALLNNRAAATAYAAGALSPLHRLDHDMADSRGTLVNIKDLDRLWFPHFARCLEPLLETEVRLIWHCDGNLMEMVPRLLEVGLRGFQGFQYEDGMDYEKICRLKARDGGDLIIIAGVSVTRTLPTGTPSAVRREMEWLVRSGPKTGLFLGCSSSITPGVSWQNLETLVEGFKYYQIHGR
ncbi:MAG TPA: hypothetical protein VM221_03845 [Armatimonadota bacterium]|nr:hypothetical protein [Armatimonadota bacterium]